MKKRVLAGSLLLVLGLLIALGPRTVFPVCGYQHGAMAMDSTGTADESCPEEEEIMSCHWIAQAALGAGLLIAVLGLLYLSIRNAEIRQGVGIALLPAGVLSLLTPGVLFEACKNPTAVCRIHGVPALYALSAAVLIIALLALVWNRKTLETH